MVNKRDGEVNSDKKCGGDVFAVGQLLEMRWHAGSKVSRTPGRRQYLVRWAGYDASHDTWEDEANVLNQELIQSFAAKNDASWRKAQREEKAEQLAVAKQEGVDLASEVDVRCN